MNVVIVNDFAYINGGASKVAIESAIGLSGKVDDVIFFSSVGEIDPRLKAHNVSITSLGQEEIAADHNRLRAFRQGLWNSYAQQSFGDVLEKMPPADTVVHLHSWTKALSSSVVREAINRGFRVVCTLHDYFAACPNGGFFNYRRNAICQLTPMSRACLTTDCDVRNYGHKLYRVVRQLVQKRNGSIPAKIRDYIYISDFSRSIIEQFLPQDSRLFFVPNPIDCKKEPPVNAEYNERFVTIGRVSPEKGIKSFLRVASSLQAQAVVVGDGIDLETCVSIYKDAKFTGWLAADRAKKILMTARALVFPSLWYETQGLVVLEATSVGVPVIVSNKTAASDFVVHGETGLLYDGEGDLREKMELLMRKPAYAAELGRNAYEHFWSQPPIMKTHVSALLRVYRKILLERR